MATQAATRRKECPLHQCLSRLEQVIPQATEHLDEKEANKLVGKIESLLEGRPLANGICAMFHVLNLYAEDWEDWAQQQ